MCDMEYYEEINDALCDYNNQNFMDHVNDEFHLAEEIDKEVQYE